MPIAIVDPGLSSARHLYPSTYLLDVITGTGGSGEVTVQKQFRSTPNDSVVVIVSEVDVDLAVVSLSMPFPNVHEEKQEILARIPLVIFFSFAKTPKVLAVNEFWGFLNVTAAVRPPGLAC